MSETEENGHALDAQMSGKPEEAVRSRTCVLYDERSGEIRHAHTVTTHGDIEPRSEKHVEDEARELVERTGRSLSGLRPLHLEGVLPRKEGVAFAVDPRTRTLEERPVRERGMPDRPR